MGAVYAALERMEREGVSRLVARRGHRGPRREAEAAVRGHHARAAHAARRAPHARSAVDGGQRSDQGPVMKPQPPRLARLLLRLLAPAPRRDEIEQGLLEHLFELRASAKGRPATRPGATGSDVISFGRRHRAAAEPAPHADAPSGGHSSPRSSGSTCGRRSASVRRMPSFFVLAGADAGDRLQRALRGVHDRRSPAARGAAPGVDAAGRAPPHPHRACRHPRRAGFSGTRTRTRSTRTCGRLLPSMRLRRLPDLAHEPRRRRGRPDGLGRVRGPRLLRRPRRGGGVRARVDAG